MPNSDWLWVTVCCHFVAVDCTKEFTLIRTHIFDENLTKIEKRWKLSNSFRLIYTIIINMVMCQTYRWGAVALTAGEAFFSLLFCCLFLEWFAVGLDVFLAVPFLANAKSFIWTQILYLIHNCKKNWLICMWYKKCCGYACSPFRSISLNDM